MEETGTLGDYGVEEEERQGGTAGNTCYGTADYLLATDSLLTYYLLATYLLPLACDCNGEIRWAS